MSRLPVRLRLTLGFGLVVTLLLAAVGWASYASLRSGVRADLDRELRQRAQDLTPVAQAPGNGLSRLRGPSYVEHGESFAEVLTADGSVVDATPTLRSRPLLSPAQASRASTSMFVISVPSAPGLDEPAQLLATPVVLDGQRSALVVGVTEGNDIETLARVRGQLLLGLPLLALLATLGGYVLMGSALRPVERMRARAASLSALARDARLPVPAGHDEFARLGVTLNDLLDRLEASSRQQRAFVASASHELRTPLAMMALELELAVRRDRSREELAASIDSAREEVTRLTALAEDLLLLTTTGEDARTGDVELWPVLERVVQRFSASADVALAPTPRLVVTGEAATLERAVTNLVSNALRHGGGSAEIAIETSAGSVEVHVLDRGAGLDPDLAGRAFDPFTRGRSTGHAGLGLTIVASIAAAHGGSAGIGDRTEGGVDAWIALPLHPAAVATGS